MSIFFWQVDKNNWQVNIFIWQVMAEICHHIFWIQKYDLHIVFVNLYNKLTYYSDRVVCLLIKSNKSIYNGCYKITNLFTKNLLRYSHLRRFILSYAQWHRESGDKYAYACRGVWISTFSNFSKKALIQILHTSFVNGHIFD